MKKLSFSLFSFVIFLIMISSMHPWFIWQFNPVYYKAILSLMLIISSLIITSRFAFSGKSIFIILSLVLVVVLSANGMNFNGYLGQIFNFLPFILLLGLKREYQIKLLTFCTTAMAVILIPSIILYLISFFVNLPSLGTITHPAHYLYVFDNYLFFIDYKNNPFTYTRFSSIFLEPGYLGTGMALLLFANNFDFHNKKVIVLLMVLIATFSLAGIVTVFVGFIFSKILYNPHNQSRLKYLFSLSVAVGILFFTALIYNDGKNIINQTIFERLKYDSDKTIAGNNRFSEGTYAALEYMMSNEELLWNGLPKSDLSGEFSGSSIAGAGYAIFILYNGLKLTIAYFIFYFLIAVNAREKLNAFTFLILIILTFLQAAYPWSASWIIPYILGISSMDKELQHSKKPIVHSTILNSQAQVLT